MRERRLAKAKRVNRLIKSSLLKVWGFDGPPTNFIYKRGMVNEELVGDGWVLKGP